MVMGDLNAKIGTGSSGDVMGPFGLGVRHERGDRWAEWCEENKQMVCNTWFRHPYRKLWTWKSPGDRYRNQIDYVTVNKRFRNSITNARTYPGADCGSDHTPVVVEMRLKLKKLKKLKRRRRNLEAHLSKLKDHDIKERYSVAVRNRFDALEEGETGEHQWSRICEALTQAANTVVPKKERKRRQEWMTEEILRKMERRRRNQRNRAEYRRLDGEIRRECSAAKEQWLNRKCDEIEMLSSTDKSVMYSKIKELTGNHKNKPNIAIKKSNGEVAMDKEEVKMRWKEYTEELFDDDRQPFEVEVTDQLIPIQRSEVEAAIKQMKDGKAIGEDGVAVEMVEAVGQWGSEVVTRLANKMYDTGQIPT